MDSYRPESDRDPQETQEWIDSLDSVVEAEGRERAQFILNRVVETARARGLDPATPAVAIASATRQAQRHAAGRADEIAALAETLPAGAPVIVILGQVARRADAAVALLEEAA